MSTYGTWGRPGLPYPASMRPTFHLVPVAAWRAADPEAAYRAASLDDEGFIHCTDGEAELLATADRHYRDDPRPFLVIELDLERVGSPWHVEDARGIYPHVFGPIDRAAIVRVRALERDPEGRFTGIGDELGDEARGDIS